MKKLKLLTLCVSALSLECFGYKCDICKNYHKEGYECPVPVIAENDRAQILNVYDDDEDDVFIKIMRNLKYRYARYGNPTWTCVPLETLSKAEFAAFLRKSLLENLDEADKGPSAEELGQYLEKLHAENHAERFSFVLRQFRSAVDSVQRELAKLADDGEEKIAKQNAEIWFRFSLRSLCLSTFIGERWRISFPELLKQRSPLEAALVDFIKYGTYINDMGGCFSKIEAEREAVHNFLLDIYINICPRLLPPTELDVLKELGLAYPTRINSDPSEWVCLFQEMFAKWVCMTEVKREAVFQTICYHIFTYLNEAIAMAISEVRTEIEKAELKSLFDVLVYEVADYNYQVPSNPRFVPPLYDKQSNCVGEKFAMIMDIVDEYLYLFVLLDECDFPKHSRISISRIVRRIGKRFCKGEYDNHGDSLIRSPYGEVYSRMGVPYNTLPPLSNIIYNE